MEHNVELKEKREGERGGNLLLNTVFWIKYCDGFNDKILMSLK
mgnify:CR=1 FL=1